MGKILAVMMVLMVGPFGFLPEPAKAEQADSPAQAAEVEASDPLANFLTILNVPARGVVCGLSGLLGSIVMGASGGARYDLAAEIIEEGCSGPWIITPRMVHGNRSTRTEDAKSPLPPTKIDEFSGIVREPEVLSSLEAFRRGEVPSTPASHPLKEIYFEFDRYDLRPDARETLEGHAEWFKTHLSVQAVEIEGHCDERGSNEYNLALGAKRAQAAKDYLIRLGVAEERLSTMSYGEELPVCYEQTEECWKQNRRARFVIVRTEPTS